MGNYSSALYTDVEDFKSIVSSPERSSLENSTLNNHVSGAEEPEVWGQNQPDLSALKFLYSVPEPSKENPEPSSASSAVSGASMKPKVVPPVPTTFQRLREEVQDMRGELDLLRSQHRNEMKLMMNELDEEKKKRLSLQVEVDRLKKRVFK